MKRLAFILLGVACAASVGAVDLSDLVAPSPAADPVAPAVSWFADFSSNQTDPESFPFSVWAKLIYASPRSTNGIS